MRIFLSHSHKDSEFVSVIVRYLEENGHEIWKDSIQIQPGDNISQKISDGLEQADAIIFIISENSLRSEWVQREFSVITLQQISKRQQRIIPIRINYCEVPSYFADRLYIDFSQDFKLGIQTLIQTLASPLESQPQENSRALILKTSRKNHIVKIRDSLRLGRLTLVCGAGISVEAGVPSWSELIVRLLESLMEYLSKNHSLTLGKKAASEFQSRYGASSLILEKYLKNNLGLDFPKEVRNALYASNPSSCPLIDSIVFLSRPQRNGKALDSIITFNFDCLIEENLTANSILNKAIFSEAINHDSNELPIYHVHGYLPRIGDINDDTELVFSEDSYHSQFIESFSWSNLIQLNKLTQNTCLFIGISLTDPNTGFSIKDSY